MSTYRTGRPSGVTIVRDGVPYSAQEDHPPAEDDELVAVVVNGDRELAERICALLNSQDEAAKYSLFRPKGDDRDPNMDSRIAMQEWDAHERNEPAHNESGAALPGPRRRLRACVERWPGAEIEGDYDPRCCRFPKSCSASVYDDEHVRDEDLEDPA